MLEARHVAAGSSGLSVGIIETQYVEPLDIELRVRSMALFDALEREHGLRIVRNGYLRLAHGEDERAAFAASVQVQRALGVARRARTRSRRGRPAGARHGASATCRRPVRAERRLPRRPPLLRAARRAGERPRRAAAGRPRAAAAPSATRGRRWLLRTGARRATLRLRGQRRRAVGGRVAALLGVPLELAPQRHEAVLVQLPRELPYTMPSVMDYTPGAGEAGPVLPPRAPRAADRGTAHRGGTRAAAADPDATRAGSIPSSWRPSPSCSGAAAGARRRALAQGWAGLYPVSPDGLPHVGPARGRPTAILAGGAGGSGIQLSPVHRGARRRLDAGGRAAHRGRRHRLAPGRPSLRTEDQSSSPGRPSLRTEDRSS